MFVTRSSRRGHHRRRHRYPPLSPTSPPPYLDKPPSYIELYGGHNNETSDTESTHFTEEVLDNDVIIIRSHSETGSLQGNSSVVHEQILDASRLEGVVVEAGNSQRDNIETEINNNEEQLRTDTHSEQASEYSNVIDDRIYSTPGSVSINLNAGLSDGPFESDTPLNNCEEEGNNDNNRSGLYNDYPERDLQSAEPHRDSRIPMEDRNSVQHNQSFAYDNDIEMDSDSSSDDCEQCSINLEESGDDYSCGSLSLWL